MDEQVRPNPIGVGDFFAALPIAVAPRLPARLRGFDTTRGRGRLMKFHYGHPETHFEVWHHGGEGRLEVGLHLEGPAALNSAGLDFLRERVLAWKRTLPRAELEPWDRGWVRLYQVLSAPELTDAVLARAAEALAEQVKTLQPLLDEFWAGRPETTGEAGG